MRKQQSTFFNFGSGSSLLDKMKSIIGFDNPSDVKKFDFSTNVSQPEIPKMSLLDRLTSKAGRIWSDFRREEKSIPVKVKRGMPEPEITLMDKFKKSLNTIVQNQPLVFFGKKTVKVAGDAKDAIIGAAPAAGNFILKLGVFIVIIMVLTVVILAKTNKVVDSATG